MKLTRIGLRGRMSLFVLACLWAAAPAWAAPQDNGVVVVNDPTTIAGQGQGNGNANGATNGQGILNGNGNANGFNTGTTGSVVVSSATNGNGNGKGGGNNGNGGGNQFVVSPVPEPGDYALMLTGLAMLGAAVRHRRRNSATVSPARA